MKKVAKKVAEQKNFLQKSNASKHQILTTQQLLQLKGGGGDGDGIGIQDILDP